MMSLKKALLGGLAIAITAACAFYYGYYTRTPQYMLKQLIQTAAVRDVAFYDAHFDSDKLFTRLFDESIEWEFVLRGSDSARQPDSQLKQYFASVREQVLPIMKQQSRNAILAGKWNNDLPVNDVSGGRGLQIAATLASHLGICNLSFQSLGEVTSIDAQRATATLTVFDRQLKQELPLQLHLEKTDAGWKVTHVDKLELYLSARKKAVQQKLDELNKPVTEKIAAAVTVENDDRELPQFKVVDVPGLPPSAQLSGDFTITNRGSQDIVSLSGVFAVKDSSDTVRFRNSFEAGNIPAGKSVRIHNQWPLDMYVPSQSILATKPDEPLAAVMKIEYVIFKDGTSLSLQDTLPESN